MRNKKNTKTTAFTLIETAIATFIMVLVLGTLVYSINSMIKLTESANNQDIAVTAIQKKIEEVKNNIENIGDYAGLFNITGLAPNPAGSLAIAQVANETYLHKLSINVTWRQSGNREVSESLETVLYQP